ncbi:hypothetical protein RhiirA4_472929 [Rhizophagus irregularis]|uniref:Uncharacterized protein n=1 Tax=Rhizophagus irregularis TaxID=588596 RepID=A0A2I1H5T6_9GLOM|nr:hypothetical protein RhiirA4_472929 [Rhizophagus irregularis]
MSSRAQDRWSLHIVQQQDRQILPFTPKTKTFDSYDTRGGKTSTAFGISMQNWSIYVDFSPIGGQYGNFMGRELEKIRARPPKYGQTEEQRCLSVKLKSSV